MPAKHSLVLASVAAACSRAPRQVSALDHVTELISDFLCDVPSRWTLESASDAGLVRLMDEIVKTEWPGVGSAFRLARFQRAIQVYAESGSVDVLQWWVTKYLPDQDVWLTIFRVAAYFGNLNVLKWIQAHDRIPAGGIAVACVEPRTVRWLQEQRQVHEVEVLSCEAARAGDFELIKWAKQQRKKIVVHGLTRAMYFAAIEGNLEMVRWLYFNGHETCSNQLMSAAAPNGHLAVMEWLQRSQPRGYFYAPAPTLAMLKHAPVVQWMLKVFNWRSEEERKTWIERALITAAGCGHFDLLQLLCQHWSDGLPFDTVTAAASGGHLHIAQWLHSKGTEVSVDAMDAAAANGHLDTIKWLTDDQIGLQCTANTMDKAASMNHLHVVRWLHEHRSEGCTVLAMDAAATNGHLSMVRWLHTNRAEGCTTKAMDGAAAHGHLSVVQWLHYYRHEGCSRVAMDKAAAAGHLHVIQWLQGHRSEGCSSIAIDEAAAEGHLEVVKFLHSRYKLSCSSLGVCDTAQSGRFAVLEWLLQHDPLKVDEDTLSSHYPCLPW